MVSPRARGLRQLFMNPETWAPYCHGTSSKAAESINENGLMPRYCIEEEGADYCLGKWDEDVEAKQGTDVVYMDSIAAQNAAPTVGCRTAADYATDKAGGEEAYYTICPDKYKELVPDHEVEHRIDDGGAKKQCKTWVEGLSTAYLDKKYDGEGRYCTTHLCPNLPAEVQEFIAEKSTEEHTPDKAVKVRESLGLDPDGWSPEEINDACTFSEDWPYSLFASWQGSSVSRRGRVWPEELDGPFSKDELREAFWDGELRCEV